jgi:hypothetical protein
MLEEVKNLKETIQEFETSDPGISGTLGQGTAM